jgi:hypothetical protein
VLFRSHQTMIVIIAFFVVDFAIPRAAQWIVLLVLAVAATFALYEIVRRVGFLRFLLGMRRRKPAVTRVDVVPVPVEAARRQKGIGPPV